MSNMTEKINTPEQQTEKNSDTLPNYTLRRAGFAAGAILGLTAATLVGAKGVEAIKDHEAAPDTLVASTVIYIPEGGTLETSTRAAVAALSEGLPGAVQPDQIVRSSQEAIQELGAVRGSGTVHPGDPFVVNLLSEAGSNEESPSYLVDVEWMGHVESPESDI